MQNKIYDIAIVGGGPAGLTAGIYSARAGLKVCIIEKLIPGGQVCLTDKIENYPGFESISGAELGSQMGEQAEKLGAEIIYSQVENVELNSQPKKLITLDGTIFAKSIILTMGASARKLGLNNEEKLIGSGVSYCATCDGAFYKNANVVVVGGGNSALEDALYLSNFASKVFLVHRRDTFRAEQVIVDQVKANDKIEIFYNSQVVELISGEKLEKVKIRNTQNNLETTIDVSGLFVAIGRSPDTEFLKGKINLDQGGFIIVDSDQQTNISGVFAAGDVTNNKLKQVVTATSSGAIAANNARIFVADKNK